MCCDRQRFANPAISKSIFAYNLAALFFCSKSASSHTSVVTVCGVVCASRTSRLLLLTICKILANTGLSPSHPQRIVGEISTWPYIVLGLAKSNQLTSSSSGLYKNPRLIDEMDFIIRSTQKHKKQVSPVPGTGSSLTAGRHLFLSRASSDVSIKWEYHPGTLSIIGCSC